MVEIVGEARYAYNSYVATPHGYVKVCGRGWDDGTSSTILEFIHAGTLRKRAYAKLFTPRYLVTLAKQFANDVLAQETTDEPI